MTCSRTQRHDEDLSNTVICLIDKTSWANNHYKTISPSPIHQIVSGDFSSRLSYTSKEPRGTTIVHPHYSPFMIRFSDQHAALSSIPPAPSQLVPLLRDFFQGAPLLAGELQSLVPHSASTVYFSSKSPTPLQTT